MPGSPVGKDKGKTTVVDGIDPNKLVTLGGKDKKKGEDEEINFCVATIKTKDLEKIS